MSKLESKLTSSRPYLLRALSEWMIDNGATPHLLVDARIDGVQVPLQFVRDGQITLNVGPRAVQMLRIDNDALSFTARFGGVPMSVYVPVAAVLAIFTKETGEGMVFGSEPGRIGPPPASPLPEGGSAGGRASRPSLKVVR